MSALRKNLELFSLQPFRWFIANCVLASYGNGLAYIAMVWLILKSKSNVSSVAEIMICFWLPWIILGPLFGILIDRYNRKWLLITASGLRAILLISVSLFNTANLSPASIYSRAIILGTLGSLYGPSAMAFVREIINKDKLLYANSAVDVSYELGNILGMGSAGFMLAFFSPKYVLMINGIFFLMAVACMLLIRHKPTAIRNASSQRLFANLLADFKLGFTYLINNRALCAIYMVQLLLMVNFMTAPIILAPFAKNILHATVGQFGELEAFLSVGVVLGGLFSPALAEVLSVKKVIFVATAMLAVCFLFFSVVSSIWTANIIYFIIGIALAVWPLVLTKAQQLTELDYQGRVQSTFNSLSGVFVLLIYFIIEFGGDSISLPMMYWLEAAIALVSGCLLWRLRKLL